MTQKSETAEEQLEYWYTIAKQAQVLSLETSGYGTILHLRSMYVEPIDSLTDEWSLF